MIPVSSRTCCGRLWSSLPWTRSAALRSSSIVLFRLSWMSLSVATRWRRRGQAAVAEQLRSMTSRAALNASLRLSRSSSSCSARSTYGRTSLRCRDPFLRLRHSWLVLSLLCRAALGIVPSPRAANGPATPPGAEPRHARRAARVAGRRTRARAPPRSCRRGRTRAPRASPRGSSSRSGSFSRGRITRFEPGALRGERPSRGCRRSAAPGR